MSNEPAKPAEAQKPAVAEAGCLTAMEIIEADDLVIERIDLPEWGKGRFAFVKTLPAHEKDEWEEALAKKKNGQPVLKNFRAKLVVITLCDKDGKLIFDMPGQDVQLGNKSAKAISRIFEKATRLNGLTDKDIEEMEGN